MRASTDVARRARELERVVEQVDEHALDLRGVDRAPAALAADARRGCARAGAELRERLGDELVAPPRAPGAARRRRLEPRQVEQVARRAGRVASPRRGSCRASSARSSRVQRQLGLPQPVDAAARSPRAASAGRARPPAARPSSSRPSGGPLGVAAAPSEREQRLDRGLEASPRELASAVRSTSAGRPLADLLERAPRAARGGVREQRCLALALLRLRGAPARARRELARRRRRCRGRRRARASSPRPSA